MITLTASAHCLRCGWTAGPGTMADIDRLAGKHTGAEHPTGVVTVPGPGLPRQARPAP